MSSRAISSSGTFRPFGYFLESNSARTHSPVWVRVDPIRLMIVARLVSGRPLQFCVINENRQGSILFHLLSPGGSGTP